MSQIKTHYDNLKVARNAPIEVISAAYRTLAKKHHPDTNGNTPESQKIMRIINDSYTILSDPHKRKKHDEWIEQQENISHNEKQISEYFVPNSGEIFFSELTQEEKEKILSRATGQNKNQYAVKLDGVFWNYIWVFIFFAWFVYLFEAAKEYRWDTDIMYWYAGLTTCASLLLGSNISWIYLWHTKPLKSWLLITPVYVMKLHLDKIWYWPIWTISDTSATHNYRNGAYQYTSLKIAFDDKKQYFSIPSEQAYQELMNQLKEHDIKFRNSIKSKDFSYIQKNDDFLGRTHSSKTKKIYSKAKFIIYVFIALLSFSSFNYTLEINSKRPIKPSYSKSRTPYNKAPESVPDYVRPSTAPNGATWPIHASYIDNYPKLNTGGLSSVTVDNSQNDSDVFVKLVFISGTESFPVRVFFIPANSSFKVSDITAGLYDIRYRDLNTGGLARSESFSLQERDTYDGTEYSNMTMTLYKVQNGNMQTYGISEEEF